MSTDNHISAILKEIHLPSITKISLQITYVSFIQIYLGPID